MATVGRELLIVDGRSSTRCYLSCCGKRTFVDDQIRVAALYVILKAYHVVVFVVTLYST